jgi:ABC-type dipeptide/oligopeptide/nickel transport system ATPase component
LLSDALELVPIGGSPPDLGDPPPGCRFAPRCPFALAACTTSGALIANGSRQAHASACLRDDEALALRTAAMDPATWQRSSNFATS